MQVPWVGQRAKVSLTLTALGWEDAARNETVILQLQGDRVIPVGAIYARCCRGDVVNKLDVSQLRCAYNFYEPTLQNEAQAYGVEVY